MKDNDFARLADKALAPLEWTDQQRMHTLRLMRQPERMPMKKKFALCIACTLLLLTGLAGALAVGTYFADLTDFTGPHNDGYFAQILDVPVVPSAVAVPTNSRHTSRWVDASITQMYLYDGRLYIVTHLTPKEANTVLYDDSVGEVILNGEPVRYFHLYRQDGLTILTSLGLTLNWDDLAGMYTPDGELTLMLQRVLPDSEGCGLTLLNVYEVPEELPLLRYGNYTLQAEFILRNVRTGEYERNVIFTDVPPMEMVHAETAE